MTIASPPTSCRSSPTSCVTPTCAAHAPCPSRRRRTMLTWWPSGPGTTWWTRSTTGEWHASPARVVSATGFGSCFSVQSVDSEGQAEGGEGAPSTHRVTVEAVPFSSRELELGVFACSQLKTGNGIRSSKQHSDSVWLQILSLQSFLFYCRVRKEETKALGKKRNLKISFFYIEV